MSRKPIDDAIGKEITKDNPKYAGMASKYLASLRHRLRRIANGQCKWSGCSEANGPTLYCPKHNVQVLENQRRGYALKKQASGGA